MNPRRWLAAVAALVATVAGGWLLFQPAENSSETAPAVPRRDGSGQRSAPLPPPPAAADVADAIDAALAALHGGAAPSATLAGLRAAISRASEEEAAAAIVAFLGTGRDAPTGQPFQVGPDGAMAAVPTLRLALLDWLPALDPLAALDVAREIMDQRTSPDEYALALRNLAWNDLDGDLRAELDRRFSDLLASPWLREPTAGVLEAFDIAVELGDRPTFDALVAVARQATAEADPDLARAAYLSLDRMILREPDLLAAAGPGWMDFAPLQRASLLSRLDPARPDHREILARYLTATDHAAGELDYFSRLFPNRNYLHGHRLVTTADPSPSLTEVTAADARTLAALEEMADRFSGPAAAAVARIRDRLAAGAGD